MQTLVRLFGKAIRLKMSAQDSLSLFLHPLISSKMLSILPVLFYGKVCDLWTC